MILGAAAFLLAGCGSGASDPSPPDKHLVEYTVRGRIVQLPAPDRPASQLIVHHEPLPSYMSGGEVVGMGEMQMPFPLKEGLTLDEYEIGQAVTLTFEVRYDPETQIPIMVQASRLEPLPAETILVFETDGAAPASGP